ncbi:MAG: hypothetical protein LBE60_06730 [Microbacterium sp.]|jgi:hypothetical protein|uniref:hypothetical protein n=1 Tax=Microbacterium sp. TaxID=51671 RepID=UPI00282E8773|nr:hypothetical protein [Microbacterium sp.]MDR2321327.1 hypothetical protein [Microbacterium sp.]
MDVFERVREIEAGTELTSDQIAGARSRLLSGIEADKAAAHRRLGRRPALLIAGAVAAVAAVTTAVVVVNQDAPAPKIETAPSPTTVPSQPAGVIPPATPTVASGAGTATTAPFPGTTPGPGQYLEISMTSEALLYRGPEGISYQWLFRTPALGGAPISALMVRDDSALFVPADRSADWVQEYGESSQRVRSFPEPQTPEDKTAWDNLIPVRADQPLVRAAGGEFPGRSAPTDFSVYPGDPKALLDVLRKQFEDAGQGRDERMVTFIVGVLRSNLAPAAVRKTFIEALGLSGLSAIDSVNGAVTTYGVDFTATGTRHETISIDAATGWATEYTVTVQRDDGGLVPAGVPDIRFTMTPRIVDAAP